MIVKPEILEACARAAHEANRVYCLAIGDNSQPSWEDAPDWQKDSARSGVHGVLINGNDPAASHLSWLTDKRAAGWKYGPVKDPEKKEHPCMVSYEELPEAQKAKDTIFVNTVITMSQALAVYFQG